MPIKVLPILIICLCSSFWARTQDATSGTKELGIVFQQYPTGSIPGISFTFGLGQAHSSLQLRAGYNIVYHGDAGVHESEDGGGPGGSLAYLYGFREDRSGLYLGGRLDFWFNSIDWKDNIGTVAEVTGTTSITVLQPTAALGYKYLLGQRFTLTPELALGVEINTQQEGADVGQGLILLAGITLAHRF